MLEHGIAPFAKFGEAVLASPGSYGHRSSVIGILFLGVLAFVIVGAAMILPAIISPKRTTSLIPYESGMDPVGSARLRFSVKFYLVAILFIVFDVEVIYLYPWAIRFKELGWTGLVEMLIFMSVLGAGYVYALRKGALDWD